MIIMSADLGASRTGLAICDKYEILAYPLCLIEEKNRDILAKKIAAQIEKTKSKMLVIGLPTNMNGTSGPSAQLARDFSILIKKYTDAPSILWDERRTTISAASCLNDTNTRGKKRKAAIDSVAAVIILQSYLAFRSNGAKPS